MKEEQKERQRPRIPRFKSREEEAEFWDTHDSTEFDWRPTRLRFAEKVQHVFSVPLEIHVLTRLIDTARAHEVGVGAFAAKLISDGLDRLGAEPAPPPNEKGKHHG